MFILQRPRFSEKLVPYPMVDKCQATVSDTAPTLNHVWLNVSCFLAWFYFTSDRGPLSAELHQPSMSLRHGLYLYSSQRDSTLGDMFSCQLVFISDSRKSKLNSEELSIFHDLQVKLVQMVT